MFPIISFDRHRRPKRLGLALALSSAIFLPLAIAGAATPAAAQSAAPPSLERVDSFTDGPQLGDVTAHSIRVWARTRQPGVFRVLYSTSPDLSGGTLSPEVTTSWEHDATGWVELADLRPNTKYYYALVKDGKVADTRVNGEVNSFLTLPDSSQFIDPQLNPKGLFNFAFEIGTGNNQANVPLPKTYSRMLADLKGRIYFQIQNGDWIYESGRDKTEAQWAAENGVKQPPRVTTLARGIAGVWQNYKNYLQNRDLTNFYREVPGFVTLDDHEILNDVVGSGEIGYRLDARGKPFQADLKEDNTSNMVERAVFRDPAEAAWRDYVGWTDPNTQNRQFPWFGSTKLTARSNLLSDPAADFTKLDLAKANNLHVLWGFGNTGVFKIDRVIDAHHLQVEPSFD
ncbi:MAG: alkaline phosphatase D family protein, partial [Porphyrobacter sp.]|nr:alkaline phosphatase D family protein [Porphyrobacter sp.]